MIFTVIDLFYLNIILYTIVELLCKMCVNGLIFDYSSILNSFFLILKNYSYADF